MEKSNLPEAVRSLGQQFVNQLGLDPGVDTFGRWMCHYIAEQIAKAEHTKGKEKEDAEEKCFNTILRFWQHRWQLPSGQRPFDNFEPILLLLESLDPDRRRNFYYRQFPHDEGASQLLTDEQSQWIKFAKQTDKAARVLIEHAIKRCIEQAKGSETVKWLKNGVETESGADLEVIGKLTDIDLSLLSEEYDDGVNPSRTIEEIDKKHQTGKIKNRIKHLQEFSKMTSMVLKELKSKLKEIEK